jgi:CheY-like chemotaxis protein/HPt (histidine-containing phosphotransfer) domain-containing protein
MRILVVEDNRSNQMIAQLFIKKLGHTADLAATGLEAVFAAAQTNYDLILMDCHMPKMDGFAATREIRHQQGKTRHTPIIAMTANTSAGDPEKCMAVGMDGYLAKPISVEKISEVLARHTAIDPSMLIQLRDQEEGVQLMHEVIEQYLQDAPRYMTAIRQGVLEGDAEKVRRAAHALKGASSNFNAGRLCALSAQFEREAEKGWLTQAAPLVNLLHAEFQNVRMALETAERKAA